MDKVLEFEKSQIKREVPNIKPGDTVRVHQRIKEGDKERVQVFEGVVIKIHRGVGINGNVTIRKITLGVGVEKTFPFHLPSIVKMEVVRRGKVRQAKLYYLRDRQQKAAKLKEKKLSEKDLSGLKYDKVADDKKKADADAKAKEDEEKKAEVKEDQKVDDEKKATTKETKAPKSDK